MSTTPNLKKGDRKAFVHMDAMRKKKTNNFVLKSVLVANDFIGEARIYLQMSMNLVYL